MQFNQAYKEYDTKVNKELNKTGIFYAFSKEQFNNNKIPKDTDTEFITELTMVLNWKIWEHYKDDEDEDSPSNKLASLYNDLWQECDNWCRDNLKGDDLSYFYNTTD